MTCPSCRVAEETNGNNPEYNSVQCQFCAARHIKRIGTLPITQSAASARMTVVLADAVAYGHNGDVIRAMVKSGPYHAPAAITKKPR